jgi:hypothetical protein
MLIEKGTVMARRNTKADRILNESAMRLEAARIREQLAQSQLNTAKAVLEAVHAAHGALEKELTAQPRKKTEKPASAPAPLPADKELKCSICGNLPGHPDHDTEHYLGAHAFEAPKSSVARGKKNSKLNSHEPKISTPALV